MFVLEPLITAWGLFVRVLIYEGLVSLLTPILREVRGENLEGLFADLILFREFEIALFG